MWLIDFGGIALPATQYESNTPRVAKFEQMEVAGSPNGGYSLYGDRAPFGLQRYTYSFLWPRVKVAQVDALSALLGTRQVLTAMVEDRSKRMTTATLVGFDDSSSVEDEVGGRKRVALDFMAEPYWYSPHDTLTFKAITFTTATLVSISAAQGNLGNVRALKYLVLYITTSITASTGSPFTITFTGGGRVYTFQIVGNMTASGPQPITIDVGANTVEAQGVDRIADTTKPASQLPFFALEPGAVTVEFSSAVSGRLEFKDTWK